MLSTYTTYQPTQPKGGKPFNGLDMSYADIETGD